MRWGLGRVGTADEACCCSHRVKFAPDSVVVDCRKTTKYSINVWHRATNQIVKYIQIPRIPHLPPPSRLVILYCSLMSGENVLLVLLGVPVLPLMLAHGLRVASVVAWEESVRDSSRNQKQLQRRCHTQNKRGRTRAVHSVTHLQPSKWPAPVRRLRREDAGMAINKSFWDVRVTENNHEAPGE